MNSPTSPVSPSLSTSTLVAQSSSSPLEPSLSNNSTMSDDSNSSVSSNYGTKTPSGNARIYNCTLCQRAFTREEHLTRHTLSTHNKLKPFTCGICTRPFSRRDLLLRHAKNLHQGSEMAVSRIRKSYKHSKDKSNNNNNSKLSQEDIKSEGDESDNGFDGTNYSVTSRTIKKSSSTDSTSTPIPTTTNPSKPKTKTPRQIEDFDTPEKKRIKISVNMLVS